MNSPPGSSGASSSSSSQQQQQNSSNREDDNKPKESVFECNICLDAAKEAVVSVCGHLFCWECLHEWFQTRNPDDPFARPVPCPVCKNLIKKDKVIPLYGRSGENKDPRERKIPPRPQGQRSTERESFNQPFFGGAPADGFHMSFGIGAFPFGFFASTFNIAGGGDFRGGPNVNLNAQEFVPEQIISKFFLWLGILFILWILFID